MRVSARLMIASALFGLVGLAHAQDECDDEDGGGENGPFAAPAPGAWQSVEGSSGNNFYGLTYSPFGLGDGKTCPPWDDIGGFCLTPERVATDMAILASMTRRIRTYSIDPCYQIVRQICGFARANGMNIQLGVWVENEESKDDEEIVKFGRIIEEFADVIYEVLVGNEVVSVIGGTRAYMERRLLQARAVMQQKGKVIPIGTADVWPVWMEGEGEGSAEGIVAAVDFIGINNHAYWAEFDPFDKDIGLNMVDMVFTINVRWNKRVVATEAGHPADGSDFGGAQTSVDRLERAAQDYEKWSRIRNVPLFFFEPFDGAWKLRWGGAGLPDIEYAWGLRDCARNPKNLAIPADGAIFD